MIETPENVEVEVEVLESLWVGGFDVDRCLAHFSQSSSNSTRSGGFGKRT